MGNRCAYLWNNSKSRSPRSSKKTFGDFESAALRKAFGESPETVISGSEILRFDDPKAEENLLEKTIQWAKESLPPAATTPYL